jgi:hypothetical protein
MPPPKNLYVSSLAAYPAYMIDKPGLEKGNKILLPSSVLKIIANYNIPYPVKNKQNN